MINDTISALEAELRMAQLASDVAALDRLVDDALVFTGPDGSLVGKADDLALHREKAVRFTVHVPEDMRILPVTDDVVVVALRTRLAGQFMGQEFSGVFRYTRVWARRSNSWRIVAGHVSAGPQNEPR